MKVFPACTLLAGLSLILVSCGAAPAASPSAAAVSPSAAASKPAAAAAASAAAMPSAAASASAKPAASGSAAAAAGKVYKVGISQFFSHPVIDDFTAGFKEGMKNAGFVEGQNVQYDIQNGQFSQDNLRAIAQKFSAAKEDLVVTLTTPATLATLGVITDIPVVFGLVTDSKAAGILKDTQKPDRNATGVESWWPPDQHMQAMKAVLPNMKRLGVPYNTGEANSRQQIEDYKKLLPTLGLTLVEANATNTNEVQAAAQSLVGKVDAIEIIGDNTVQGAIGAVLKVGFENKLPVISVDPENAKDGVLAGWGIQQKLTGQQAGELAAKVLKGAKTADTPVEKPKRYWWTVNTAAAQRLGITIPADVLSKVDEKFDTVKVQ
jgi:putative ABC transport system substrate-binding protein